MGGRLVLPARLARPIPQLHIHNTILNRVGADGTWRTLDGRSIYRWRYPPPAPVAETHLRGAPGPHAPGCWSRPARTRKSRGSSASQRRRWADLLAPPRGRPRPPSAVRRVRAALRRPPNSARAGPDLAKPRSPHGRRSPTMARPAGSSSTGSPRIRTDIDGGLAGVAPTPRRPPRGVEPQAFNPQAVIEVALADVAARKSSWTRADLTPARSTPRSLTTWRTRR
ncbi:relaxase domain-containing protein [Pseudonocardia sp. MCCB 268]|nr:relaxase domain-containing protein [Pseudonocardia cytotoxica]